MPFVLCAQKKGDKLLIKRTGEGMETKWSVKKVIHNEATTSEQVINDNFSNEEPPF